MDKGLVAYDEKGNGIMEINSNGINVRKISLKDNMINKLKEYNQKCVEENRHMKFATVLRYKDGDEEKYVEDYSFFAKDYMSNELMEALKNGQTLTEKLQDELNKFKVEIYYDVKENKILDESDHLANFFLDMSNSIKKLEKEVAHLKSKNETKVNMNKYYWDTSSTINN